MGETSAYVKKMILQNAQGKLILKGNLVRKWKGSFLNEVPIQLSTFSRYPGTLSADVSYLFENKSYLSLNTSFPVGLLTNSKFEPVLLFDNYPDQHYTLLNLSGSWRTALSNKGVNYMLNFVGQYSDSHLFSDDLITVTSKSAVIGFNGLSLSRNSGFYAKNILSFPTLSTKLPGKGVNFSFVPNISYNFVYFYQDGISFGNISVSSFSFGFSANPSKSTSFSLDFGIPLHYPENLSYVPRGGELYFAVDCSF